MFCANSLAGRFQQAWLADFFSRCGWKIPVPALVLLVNPLTLNFGFGVAEWFRNRPSIYGWGLPSSDASNLDPDTRLYYASGGCVIVGGEWVFDAPHNLGLRLVKALFGRPPRVYGGPYPSQKEAIEATDGAPPTKAEDLLKGYVRVSGKTITLSQPTTAQILNDLDQTDFELGDDIVQRSVRAVVYKERCLIVRVRTKNLLFEDKNASENPSNHDGCILFDLQTGRAFARYGFHGYLPRFPRLLLEN